MTGAPPGGVCIRCDRYDPDATLVDAVEAGSGLDRPRHACPSHASDYGRATLGSDELRFLARRRAVATGETPAQARAALEGGGRRRESEQ